MNLIPLGLVTEVGIAQSPRLDAVGAVVALQRIAVLALAEIFDPRPVSCGVDIADQGGAVAGSGGAGAAGAAEAIGQPAEFGVNKSIAGGIEPAAPVGAEGAIAVELRLMEIAPSPEPITASVNGYSETCR